MKIKTTVKVMNFHSLLHIDSARRQTEKYIRMESEVSKIIDLIVNNRNFILDKHVLRVNEFAPELNIYIGSDLSFCGALNSQVNSIMMDDEDADKIIVGRKLRSFGAPNVILRMTKEEFDEQYDLVERELEKSVHGLLHSSINVIYNHYYYAGRISIRKKKIFPVPLTGESSGYTEDFAVEGDVDRLLRSLVSTYCGYEVKIASINSFASENVMRQNATTESLKKIDEIMAENLRVERKEKRQKAFGKVLEGYVKKSVYGGENP